MKNKSPKIALVHDYLREYGGAERVLESLHAMYPKAPVYTAFVDEKAMGIHWSKFADWDIRTTWITKIPFYKKLHSPLRIFAPQYFSALDLSEFDIVISSSNAYFSKAVIVPNGVQYCFCHTPARSLYGYETMSDWKKNPFIRLAGTLINHYLRIIDFEVAQKVDYFIANSEETARRIKKFYRRDSVVINPPVRIPIQPPVSKVEKKYFLYASRLTFSKHPDLAVSVCTKLNLPLKVVGEGKMLPRLKKIAGPTIEFIGSVDDQQLSDLYSGAKSLLYPVKNEDFGMVPIEAMGHGLPVIAHRSGGPCETIVDGETGVLFDELSVSGLEKALKIATKKKFDQAKIYRHAKQYSEAVFVEKIRNLVTEK
ncbi:MAG: glycosyl transferase [Candidatus Pacebacteria bacterium CG10_big_fil_rev_8_21_14_0_10_42_12]|nr:glycosyltransferase family 4 protein [Candidatus Paceibacterota bacterium]PIR63082.1 MAG: glycosyl transferase [Candidatus Pacebacteria bacterium CG10_big_fil_rev_8_21_14_0_10_42_12]